MRPAEADEIDAVEDGLPWRKGDLACKVDTAYGELAKFCDERGWDYGAVRVYKVVAQAYPESLIRLNSSFGVCQVFASQPDRLALIASRDDWTVREARELVAERL